MHESSHIEHLILSSSSTHFNSSTTSPNTVFAASCQAIGRQSHFGLQLGANSSGRRTVQLRHYHHRELQSLDLWTVMIVTTSASSSTSAASASLASSVAVFYHLNKLPDRKCRSRRFRPCRQVSQHSRWPLAIGGSARYGSNQVASSISNHLVRLNLPAN